MFHVFALGIPGVDQTNPSPICAPLRRPQNSSKQQHRICRVVQYNKAARLRMLTLACSSANAAFNRSTSSTTCHINEGTMLIGLIPGRKPPGVGLFLAWSRLQSKPPNPNWYPKRQSHQSPLPGVRLQRFRIKKWSSYGRISNIQTPSAVKIHWQPQVNEKVVVVCVGMLCFLSPDFSI